MTTYPDPVYARDYQSLCATVADTLNRGDLVTAIPSFIVLASARISRDVIRMRHPRAIARASCNAHAGYAPLPNDFVVPYKLTASSNTLSAPVLEYVSPDDMDKLTPANTSGAAQWYTIIGREILLLPAPTNTAPVTLDFWYYQIISDLSTIVPSNWVLDQHPDLYLYGALLHSAPYLKDDARVQLWSAAYTSILSDIEIEASRANRPDARMKARAASFG